MSSIIAFFASRSVLCAGKEAIFPFMEGNLLMGGELNQDKFLNGCKGDLDGKGSCS